MINLSTTSIKDKILKDWKEESEFRPNRLWFMIGIGAASIGYSVLLWAAVLIRG